MAIQTTYSETIDQARAGMIANSEPNTLLSRTVEDADGVGFGAVVQQGTNDNGCLADLDTSDMDANTFLGIIVRERSVNPATPNKFAQYESARILRKGPIWVEADGAVSAGDDVTVTLATGALGTKAVTSGVVAIPNARWDTSAADGALAVVRLG